MLLSSSSFFSFVYICDYVVYKHQSGYVDDNVILTSSCKEILNNTSDYIEEDTKAMQILSNKLLSQLQYKYSQNTTQGQKLSKSDLENNVQIASINYNEAKLTYEDIKDKAEKLKKKLDSYDAAFNSTTWHNQQNKWDSKYKTVEKDLKNTNKQKKLDQTKYQNAKYEKIQDLNLTPQQ